MALRKSAVLNLTKLSFTHSSENLSRKVLPIHYAENNKKGLEAFLEDGNCNLSNNWAENSIRPFTIGRKNWLFSGSPKGAAASAAIYSLIETCKANKINE